MVKKLKRKPHHPSLTMPSSKLLIILSVSFFGLVVVTASWAATNYISLEAEGPSNTLSSEVTTGLSSSASNGNYVQFGSIDTGAPTFRDDFNSSAINESVWTIGTWYEHGGQLGRERTFLQDGKLNLVFRYDPAKGFLSSALESKQRFGYGTWKASLKPTACPGVLNSMYTIDWDDPTKPGSGDGSKEEIDIEFLTKSFANNFGRVHLAVHEYGNTSFDTNPDIPLNFNPSDEFRVYGFTITPEKIEWFLGSEDNVLQTYRYSENAITIDNDYTLKFNVWSQFGQWIQGPPPANTNCTYQVDWIQFNSL